MKIKYCFADGTTAEVEVNDDIGTVIHEFEKAEHANDMKHIRHCYPMDAMVYEGIDYADPKDIDSVISEKVSTKEFYEIYDTLTETQKRRVEMLGVGLSIREIARREGVNLSKIQKSIAQVQKKYADF